MMMMTTTYIHNALPFNLSHNEHKALNLKEANKGTTTVIVNKCDKIKEGQTHLNNREHYRSLEKPKATETVQQVNELITELHKNKILDDIMKKWLTQTCNPPRI